MKNKKLDEVIDALNRLDEHAQNSCEDLDVREMLTADYDLVFDFINENRNKKKL